MVGVSAWIALLLCALILVTLFFGSPLAFTVLARRGRQRSLRPHRSLILLVAALQLALPSAPISAAAAEQSNPLAGDALRPPTHPPTIASSDFTPSLYQPSAFLAGRVVVQALFVESDGSKEPSTRDWTTAQMTAIQQQLTAALAWWAARLPNARLSFELISQIVPSGYEPILHTEGQWAGDTLTHMGFNGIGYIEQAYAADERLRRTHHADWATTIFVVNSAGKADGRFADGHFAYAYVGGPFLVVTSDAGPYGTSQIAPVVAHELGHIFGALDQYAAASTPCTEQSGYLAVPATNSQANDCGSHFICIMLEPLTAYVTGAVDRSARGQIGDRDSDDNGIPDPLDTRPAVDLRINQPAGAGRPTLTGTARDQPFPALTDALMTINIITKVEYRVDGGDWTDVPPTDGAYDSATESVNFVLPLYDGQHTVELRAMNSVGTASPVMSASVRVEGVGAAPAYAVNIPQISNANSITVSLTAPISTEVQLSEDRFFGNASWVLVAPILGWQFGPEDGKQTLYVRFRDAAGLDSPPFARQVLLDRTPPTGRAIIHNGTAPWLELQTQDSGSKVEAVQLNVSNGVAGDWRPFQVTMPLPPGTTKVEVRIRDAAGNVSTPLPTQSTKQTYLPLATVRSRP